MLSVTSYITDLGTAISNGIRRGSKRCVMSKSDYRFWKENDRLLEFQPAIAKAKVVIAAMGADGLKTHGKVNPKRFFPPFCRVLKQGGIGSVYVNDMAGVERELQTSRGVPIILLDLVNEDYDYLDAYDIPDALYSQPNAVFNSRRIAKIIKDKKETNALLSRNGISMPNLTGLENKKIFSNARSGSQETVLVYEGAGEIDDTRYNTEFIDTRVEFEGGIYYTTVRLMCIGSSIVQIYIRARDERGSSPSVHSKDTPVDRPLLDYMHRQLVKPRLDDYVSLAADVESVLGPGFYAHDVLVDNSTGELFLCETGYKYYDHTYSSRMKPVLGDREFRYGVVDQSTYAAYAGAVFVTYCTERGFL